MRVAPDWVPIKSISLKDEPSALAVTDDGGQAFIGTGSGDVLQWQVANSTVTKISRDNGRMGTIAIAPNGLTLAMIGIGARVEVCALNNLSARCNTISLGPREWGYNVAFSPDSRWLGMVSGIEGDRGTAMIWDVQAKTAKVLPGHKDRVSQILFDKTSQRAITTSWDGTARIWNVFSGMEIAHLTESKGRLFTAGFSADGEWVATSFNDKTVRLWRIPKALGSQSQPLELDVDKSVLVSDSEPIGQILFGFGTNILAGTLQNGGVNLWHVPDGTLRAVLQANGSRFQNVLFNPSGQITAMTQDGRLLSWTVPPAVSFTEANLLSAARSVLPLAGALVGKVTTDMSGHVDSASRCGFVSEHNIGLPPHSLSGDSRARASLSIPAGCSSSTLQGKRKSLLEALIAEAEGDPLTAHRKFLSALREQEYTANIGLGDLSFKDGSILKEPTLGNAIDYYTAALSSDAPHARSRLGWLLLANPTVENVARSRQLFEDSSKRGDADGYAGLAWIDERFGKSTADIERAISNYIRAQHAYEADEDLKFAEDVAQRRAMLSRLMEPEKAAELFVSSRGLLPSTGTSTK